MAEKDQSPTAEDESPPVDYAFWDIPGESFRVVYSLQLFHEVDFVVNEGYRKIPHGGIETAGLLLGSISKTEVRIEAFQPIECEHVAGPSLHFSERDLNNLEVQIDALARDGSREKCHPVGWFLGHTRGSLELSEAEAKHFDRFFPEPARVAVLVKPERFQPTRFSFLVRKPDGEMPRDGLASAVILPLPGRSFKPGQLVPSIPAPNPIAVKRPPPDPLPDAETPVPRPVSQESSSPRRERKNRSIPPTPPPPPAPQKMADPPALDSIWKIPPDLDSDEATEPEDFAPPPPPPANRDERRKLARDRARLIEAAYPHPQPHPQSPAPEITPFRPAAMPSLPMDVIRYLPSAYDRYPSNTADDEDTSSGKSVLNARSVTALALAALLGCLVGYIAYLQLPAPVIPIDVRPLDQTIVVSWPPEETRNAVYAAIRLNDGAAVPLSAQEKRSGHVSLSAARDFKVEIVARNWIRDSRGIVRYLHSNNGNGLASPTSLPSSLPMDAPPSP
jgi:hypothetical protein